MSEQVKETPKAAPSSSAGSVGSPRVVRTPPSSPPEGGPGGEAPRQKVRAAVNLDMKPEDVIHLDSEGYLLSFPAEPALFVELSEDVQRALSYDNRVAYGVAQALCKDLRRAKANSGIGIEVIPPSKASAGRRLEVTAKDPIFFSEWHTCWKRPDELAQAKHEGYSVCGDEVESMYWDGSSHRISAFGQTELVLMKCRKATFEAIESESGAKSRTRIESQKNATAEAAEKIGLKTFDPDRDRKSRQWKESGEEGVNAEPE